MPGPSPPSPRPGSSPDLRAGPHLDPSEADERMEDGADHLEQVGLERALQRRDCQRALLADERRRVQVFQARVPVPVLVFVRVRVSLSTTPSSS